MAQRPSATLIYFFFSPATRTAIWLKPATNAYGPWPASGEMDLVESRGNANLRQISTGEPLGVQKVGATLHFGPNSSYNIWRLTHWEKYVDTVATKPLFKNKNKKIKKPLLRFPTGF